MKCTDANSFSLNAYEALLKKFAGEGYVVVSFDQVEKNSRHLVLRHDVDVSLSTAVKLAEVENNLGYASHYFILLTSEQYNPATSKSRMAIEQILALGHSVGLHFDASIKTSQELEHRANQEIEWLSNLIDSKVSMISFHRPIKEWIDSPKTIAGVSHTYQPKYFSEIGYCSDSRGQWQYGMPLTNPAVKSGRALQLLTHPIWWVDSHRSPAERLESHLFKRNKEIMIDLETNIRLRKQSIND